MPLFGTNDQSNNAPIWAPAQVRLAPNAANRDDMFGNSTGNAFTTGQTVGVVAADATECAAQEGKITHAGWQLKITGSGGRAGRVFYECLVAGGIATDNEDTLLPDYTILIDTHPTSKSVNNNSSTTFGVVAHSVGPGGPALSYQWQFANSLNISAAGVYSNVTTATLAISNVAGLTGNTYKCLVFANATASNTSTNAVLTVV